LAGVADGPSFHHVRDHAVHDQVADDYAHRRAHERVRAAAMPARPDVAPLRADRRSPFEDDLPEEEHEHPRDVEAVREERAIARIRALVLVDPAAGARALAPPAGEAPPAARAAVGERPAPRRPPMLDLGAVRRLRAGHLTAAHLLDPAERRDVVVRAEQDAGLAGAGL